jgi:glycerol-3-phosphate dehydrogenase
MIDGFNYGDNAKAAFITRGLTEMSALSLALGASPLTLSGLSGLGDLIATCASPLSRNHFVGYELSHGKTMEEIKQTLGSEVSEGVTTTAGVGYSPAAEAGNAYNRKALRNSVPRGKSRTHNGWHFGDRGKA